MVTALKQQPTAFEKIEKYITKVAEDYKATIEKSNRSIYFKFNDRVLRLSNHIGKNSSGAISIIVPNRTPTEQEQYIVHIHSTGNLQTFTFPQVKEFVRTFALISDFLEPVLNMAAVANVQLPSQKDSILGYPSSYFTEGQLNQIKMYIQQNRTSHKQ